MKTAFYQILILFLLFTGQTNSAQEKPNVLMIVLDDLNDFVGVMGGHPQARTPHIDKFASQGVLFLNAHSNVPVCMPSRASFMNGILPTSSGNWGFENWLKNETLINSKSLPEYFRDNGYQTFQTGKVFHNAKKGVWDEMGAVADYGPMAFNGIKAVVHPSCPEAMGVLGPLDATFASLADVPEVQPNADSPGYKGWRNTHRKTNSHFNYEDNNNRDLMTDEKSVQWFETKIKALEKDEQGDPFFLSVGLIRPHTPLVVPQKYFDKFPIKDIQIPVQLKDDKNDTRLAENSKKEPRGRTAFKTLTESYSNPEEGLRKYTQAYLASVAFADDMVGKLLKVLDNSRFKKNTIVVLFSDHGYNLGQKDYLFKYSLWEESTRVPLIMRIPKNEQNAGKKVQSPVSLIDLYPTLKDLCNLKGTTLLNERGGELDGFSLKPLIENPEAEQWDGPDVALSVIASWKSNKPEDQHLSVRSRDFRYIHYFNGAEELYDHRIDQYEWNNIANDPKYAEIKQTLKKKLFLEIGKE
ncbi:sulfatase [Lutimonas saemankumensis]|uniref:sulfatase n=1 Tax=Lutimonas saemankumensis TaxID=483016 RepID=UPI001CD4CF55|nr:sulfatase [Lutimonas saemankumensis]MCA0932498.1 sulfatase [Lutimonas saemankumensis]